MKKRTMALLAAVLLVVGVAIGGTLAWLTATSDTVVNTFTTSDIKIELKEDTGTEYKMIPGYTIEKDPKVKVLAGSEACYLFVKLEKSENFDNYMTYGMADGWTELTGVSGISGVYYREVENSAIGTEYSVLNGNQVTVKGTVTTTDMKAAETNKPTLTVRAYASQLYKNNTDKFTAAEAWGNISK